MGSAVDLGQQAGLSVYPNPFSQRFQVRLNGMQSGLLDVYDAQGCIVLSMEMNGNEAMIDAERVPGGIYLMKLRGSETAVRMAKQW